MGEMRVKYTISQIVGDLAYVCTMGKGACYSIQGLLFIPGINRKP